MAFWLDPRILSRSGRPGGEFHNPVIEQRRTHLKRVRHAHAVDFVEQVVGQVVQLIEQQIPVDETDFGGCWQVAEAARADDGRSVPEATAASASTENDPFQNRWASSEWSSGALQPALQLVFEADLRVETGMNRRGRKQSGPAEETRECGGEAARDRSAR